MHIIKLGRHVHNAKRMHPIDFAGRRWKVKFTIDIYGNNFVNTIEIEPLYTSLSNFADILTMVRGWTLLLFKVTSRRPRSPWTCMVKALWTQFRLNQTIKLGWHIIYHERMNPIDFFRSEVKCQGHNGHTWK